MTDINLDMQNLATVRDKKQVRPDIAVCLLDLYLRESILLAVRNRFRPSGCLSLNGRNPEP